MSDARAPVAAGPAEGGRPRRVSAWALALLLPFSVLVCDLRWELVATAACLAVLTVPGLLAVRWLFPPGHPLRELPAGFGTAMTFALLVFGLPALVALKLHWRLPTFLAVFAGVCVALCAALHALGPRRRVRKPTLGADAGLFAFPTLHSRVTVIVLLAALALTMMGAGLGSQTDQRPWWHWTSVGAAAGLAALAAGSLDARRGKRSAPRAEPAPAAFADSGGAWAGGDAAVQRVALIGLGVLSAALTVYLMKSAYAWPRWDSDDVTHVARAVDYLSGEPLDCYEPSLGFDIPMEPGYVLGTVSLLSASIAWVTGLPPAALQHSLLLPLFVLAGVCALHGLLQVVLGRDRLLSALGLTVLLLVLVKTSEGHRSLVHFLVYRVAQPKSVHLMVILPVQLALLLLTVNRPARAHTIGAIAAAVAGHLIHPWSTAVGAVWSGTLAGYALVLKRSALRHVLLVAGSFALCGGLHYLDARVAPFAVGPSPATAPVQPRELVFDQAGQPRPRLDPAETIGQYSLFRLGILSVPWLLLLGWKNRACLLVGVLSLAALALAYFEPLGLGLAKLTTLTLFWRTRWMVPSLLNAALLGLCAYWLVTALFRPKGGPPPRAGHTLVAAAVALAATCGTLALMPARLLPLGGPVADLTKFDPRSRAIAEVLRSLDRRTFLLAPREPRHPLSRELCQLLPDIRLIVTRAHVVEWFLGPQELRTRLGLIDRFYGGRMSPAEFGAALRQLPFDVVIVDFSEGRGDRQVQLLSALGWERGQRVQNYELWRRPAGDRRRP